MKKLILMALAVVVSGAAHASPIVSVGQPLGRAKLVDVMGGVYLPDTTARWLSMDASSNLKTAEQFPAMDANLTFSNITPQASLTIGAAESSAVLDTHRMRLGMLFIKPIVNGTGAVDTTTIVRLIVQIRTHLNGVDDSMSTAAIYNYGYVPAMNGTAAAAVADTSVQGHLYSGVPITAQAATPSANTAWSGEFTVLISGKRNAHGSGAGGFDVNGHTFYYPNAIAIPISSLFGRDVYSPYTSVRIRNGGANKPSTAAVTCRVSIVGTPL